MRPPLGDLVPNLAAQLGQEPPLPLEQLRPAPGADRRNDVARLELLQPALAPLPRRPCPCRPAPPAVRERPAARQRERAAPLKCTPPRRARAASIQRQEVDRDRRASPIAVRSARSSQRPGIESARRRKQPGANRRRGHDARDPPLAQRPHDRPISVLRKSQHERRAPACPSWRRSSFRNSATGIPRGKSISSVSSFERHPAAVGRVIAIGKPRDVHSRGNLLAMRQQPGRRDRLLSASRLRALRANAAGISSRADDIHGQFAELVSITFGRRGSQRNLAIFCSRSARLSYEKR